MIGYIEDDEAHILIMKGKLSKWPVSFYQTLRAYIQSKTKHDFVICDFQLPDTTLKDFFIAANKEKCPFVMFTGSRVGSLGEEVKDVYKRIGIERIYEKGVDDDKLVNYVQSVVGNF